MSYGRYMADFQSTRPLRGATLNAAAERWGVEISIHAPLAGRDPRRRKKDTDNRISIHAPLAGRDLAAALEAQEDAAFQSTRPLRGATSAVPQSSPQPNFNPRAPCGARHREPLAGR